MTTVAPPGTPVVVGAGLAGLITALHLAPAPCTVVTTGTLGSLAASSRALGGLAAAVGPGDSPALHAADTLAAGAGLCDPEVVGRVTGAAPEVVAYLSALGAQFDRDAGGAYLLGLEGAHGRHRIVHAGGDGSGAEIMRAVVQAVRATPSVTVLEHTRAHDVLVGPDGVTGLVVDSPEGRRTLPTGRVVLATGGAGGLWQHTTNPTGALGQGLALATRAGALVRDLEMVQFHPTALDVGLDPMPLVSEAVRGAGAVLVNAAGDPLLADSLAARDVVARAVHAHTRDGLRVYLDARGVLGNRIVRKFPAFGEACTRAGIDPSSALVPVRAAAHYHCGGVAVDGHGRTTVPGLWACGEVASTGLHGANRLASNSLLEAVVLGRAVAEDLAGTAPTRVAPAPTAPAPTAPAPTPADPWGDTHEALPRIRAVLEEAAGVLREGPALLRAVEQLREAVHSAPPSLVRDAAISGLLVCASALARAESRGGHTRTDHPGAAAQAVSTTLCLADVLPAERPALRRSA